MNMKVRWPGVVLLATLFAGTSSVIQAHQPTLVGAESEPGKQVPIEGEWIFPGCEIDDEIGPFDVQEFLIFSGKHVEGRVVQYPSQDGTCSGTGETVLSETAKIIFTEAQIDDTCWDGEIPWRQDSSDTLAANPQATWLVYWLGEGETETGLYYIDDTGDSWYLWRYFADEDNGDEEENGNGNGNGGEPYQTAEPACPFALSNDEPLVRLSLPAITAAIDIRPLSEKNPVNPRSKGVLPVAVLGSVDFDATQIDVSTVGFGAAEASPVNHGLIKDINADGFMDVLYLFKTQATGIACGDSEATLSGETFAGIPFTGTDAVTTVGCN